jgi:hypothetical protein
MRGLTPKYKFGLYGPHSKLSLLALAISATCAALSAAANCHWDCSVSIHARPVQRLLCLVVGGMVCTTCYLEVRNEALHELSTKLAT